MHVESVDRSVIHQAKNVDRFVSLGRDLDSCTITVTSYVSNRVDSKRACQW
eukprot:m.1645952 g.1645952  ORF g.1645952 m.1645952 type:complete len:51 (+) comp69187_c0_seq1:306-458(+)